MAYRSNLVGKVPPTAIDDVNRGYRIGSRWTDKTHNRKYTCTDATNRAAIWIEDMADVTDQVSVRNAGAVMDPYEHPSAPPCQAATAAQDGHATAAQITKLDGIETGADKTDATNVNAAGAVMLSDATIAFDTLTEKTGGHGVDVETINLKDGHINELQKLIFADPTELTIAAGEITVTQSRHRVDTQDNDAADDLVTINGGEEGQLLVINPDTTGRDVTLKHATGNILISSGDYVMNSAYNIVMLIKHGTYWMKLM